MTDRRVVITGLGVVTPVGNDLETFWSNLKNGVSGIHTIDAFDTTAYDCKIGGQVRGFDPKLFFKNPKDVRRTDRFSHLAMAAAKMALEDSGIDLANLKQRDRFGVLVSSGIGGLKTLQDHNNPFDQGTLPDFAVHDSNAAQQHGERPHLDGVRPARA
jgi:3-oxoacyl-[acyl-carrier-protein] synthase II